MSRYGPAAKTKEEILWRYLFVFSGLCGDCRSQGEGLQNRIQAQADLPSQRRNSSTRIHLLVSYRDSSANLTDLPSQKRNEQHQNTSSGELMGKWHKLMLTCLLKDVTALAAPAYICWRVKKKVAQGNVGLPSQKRSSSTILRLLVS